MQINDITTIIASLPEARKIGGDAYWREVVPNMVPMVLDEIVGAYDFDFTCKTYSDESTVSGTSEYTIRGDSRKDCRDIISIRYGNIVLDRKRALDVDQIVSDEGTGSGVWAWSITSRSDDGYPVVKIINTPAETKTLNIRYRRKDVGLEEFPDEFGYVIAQGTLAWINPYYRRFYDRAFKKMVKRYDAGGRDVDIAPVNPQMMRTNRTISGLYGTG